MEEEIYHSEKHDIWLCALAQDLFPGDLILEIGRSFLGAPYLAGTLEEKGREKLVVNLSAFDCTTFVESALALARCVRAGKLTALEFRRNLKFIRYRGGKIDGYASRLHYFIDWLGDNKQKKVITDISHLLGGKPRRKTINFMTTHRELYAALKGKTVFEQMQKVEQNISRRPFHMIDNNKVARWQGRIQPGDIIAFASSQEGLDVAHVGFAVRQGKHLHLLHASSREGAVVISKETLSAYLKSNKKFYGIMVARFS